MVARVVPLRAMTEDVRCPAVCCMTHITLFIRVYMTIWLGCRTIAWTVTAIAIICSAGIMEPRATDEGRGGMTEMAIQRSRYVIITLTGRRNPVAGRAIVDDAGMIKHRSGKGIGVMTDTAILIC